MPGYNSSQLVNNVQNANQVLIVLGEQAIAFAQTASHNTPYGTEALHGIGSAAPQEIQQMQVSPSITITSLSLTAAGRASLSGNSVIGYQLGNNSFDIHIVDGTGNDVLYTYVGCVAQNFSQSISANRPVSEDISFLAMDVLDGNGDSILNSNSAFTVITSAADAAANLGSAL